MLQGRPIQRRYTIAIDARSAQYTGSGVPRYSAELIKSLGAFDSQFDFQFLVNEQLPVQHIEFPANSMLIRGAVAKNSLMRDPWEQIILPRLLKRNGVNIFHGLDYMIPWISSLKSVVNIHDTTVFSKHDTRRALAKARLRFTIRRAARAADSIVTLSHFSASQIEQCVPEGIGKISVVWPGVSDGFRMTPTYGDLQSSYERISPKSEFVLYYGGYRSYKRVDLLLHAFAMIAAEYPHQLVLVGNPQSIPQEVLALPERLGIKERVLFFGYASDTELRALLHRCKLFVFPSATEGFGLPVVEAMSCGAPILCSTGGALPEIAGNAVVYFEEPDAAAVAAVIQQVLVDEALRQRLRNDGLRRSELFQWSVAAEKMSAIYTAVAERPCH